ncbi:probable U3 small nucleolar RNA-associated protein 11 isoform X2 [Octopus bimaculoides]|uniref:probable U3 small nucleolar RNA-associated protein 11 isoform X2 n=1 Tax=Octopus bimaculoides TaxID=37653 RepID=UPI0022E12E85|nr:probable U3 small nucleolar RNA-associated protein 11 isoform X2 [Octopus bimaculoides]
MKSKRKIFTMSSFKNARKSGQKMHKERSQPSAREKLGFLEKKKDYKRRATEDQRRKGVIKSLKVKALNRNPDEFYFNMVRNKKVDGIHQPRESAEKVHTEDQVKLMLSRDLKYIRMKRMTESNKIKRLTAELHLLDTADEIKNNHTIFVDTEADVKKFDAAEHFHTHPLLVNRRHNRIKTDQLQQMDIGATLDEQTVESLALEQKKQYNLLKKRLEREKNLKIIEEKMQQQKNLLNKKEKRTKVAKETQKRAAQYRWKFQRKR